MICVRTQVDFINFQFQNSNISKKHVIINIPGRIYLEVIRPKTRDESVTLQAIIDNVLT